MIYARQTRDLFAAMGCPSCPRPVADSADASQQMPRVMDDRLLLQAQSAMAGGIELVDVTLKNVVQHRRQLQGDRILADIDHLLPRDRYPVGGRRRISMFR